MIIILKFVFWGEKLPPLREKVERKAASRYLKNFENIGIVESQKVGREILYINKELIEILKQ